MTGKAYQLTIRRRQVATVVVAAYSTDDAREFLGIDSGSVVHDIEWNEDDDYSREIVYMTPVGLAEVDYWIVPADESNTYPSFVDDREAWEDCGPEPPHRHSGFHDYFTAPTLMGERRGHWDDCRLCASLRECPVCQGVGAR